MNATTYANTFDAQCQIQEHFKVNGSERASAYSTGWTLKDGNGNLWEMRQLKNSNCFSFDMGDKTRTAAEAYAEFLQI